MMDVKIIRAHVEITNVFYDWKSELDASNMNAQNLNWRDEDYLWRMLLSSKTTNNVFFLDYSRKGKATEF